MFMLETKSFIAFSVARISETALRISLKFSEDSIFPKYEYKIANRERTIDNIVAVKDIITATFFVSKRFDAHIIALKMITSATSMQITQFLLMLTANICSLSLHRMSFISGVETLLCLNSPISFLLFQIIIIINHIRHRLY